MSREVFPYLVVLIGLENILVLVKAVISTPKHLDVNRRIAKGMSRLHLYLRIGSYRLIVSCVGLKILPSRPNRPTNS